MIFNFLLSLLKSQLVNTNFFLLQTPLICFHICRKKPLPASLIRSEEKVSHFPLRFLRFLPSPPSLMAARCTMRSDPRGKEKRQMMAKRRIRRRGSLAALSLIEKKEKYMHPPPTQKKEEREELMLRNGLTLPFLARDVAFHPRKRGGGGWK